MNVYEKLANVQSQLKCNKSQYNSFGKYKYRSCEDIVESVKPLLKANGLLLTLSDELVLIGDRYYVKATATVFDVNTSSTKMTADTITVTGAGAVTVTAYAREEETKKGMDGSQVTGASSSYARKYALNGLFAIDDTKDSDATNTHGKDEPEEQPAPTKAPNYRNLLIAKLKERGIDVNEYEAEKGLTNKTTAERFMELLAELG